MLYEMHLSPVPFNRIATGRKDIEMRLFTEGRKNLQKGDIIKFINWANSKTMEVEVVDVYKFPTFKELYEFFPKERLGYSSEEVADYKDMYVFYPKEKIKTFGVIGIEVKLIKEN